jgi:hypothetical protein
MSELVFNQATYSDSGLPVSNDYDEPVHNQEGGSPLPDLTLNFRQGQQPEIVMAEAQGVRCRCPDGSPMPELLLNYATAPDGGTVTSIVANDGIHSYDTTQPVKIGGRHGTDEQYGDGPAIRQAEPEEMSEADKRRIGLIGGQPLDSPVLSFKKDARGQTMSEIVNQ